MSEFPLGELSKPITKLIETVSSGIGVLFEPTRVIRKAKADAEAIKILAKAKVEALAIHETVLREQYFALEQEKLSREFQQKINRDNVIIETASQLKGRPVNDTEVDKDWATQFFSFVEDVSDSQMQLIWAKLLAKEIEKPGSYSKRSMLTLKYMSVREAKTFQSIVNYSLTNQNGNVVFPMSAESYLREINQELGYSKRTRLLEDLNLISIYNFPVTVSFGPIEGKDYVWIENGEMAIKITGNNRDDLGEITLQGQLFTEIGQELARLVTYSDQKIDYLQKVVPALLSRGSKNGKIKTLVAEFGRTDENKLHEHTFLESETLRWTDISKK